MRSFFKICAGLFLGLVLQACDYSESKIKTPASVSFDKPTGPAAQAVVSFSLIKQNIGAVCTKCHIHQDLFADPASLTDNMTEILDRVTSNNMPPAKKGFAPLTDCQKAILQTWFDQGGPEETTTPVNSIPACAAEIKG